MKNLPPPPPIPRAIKVVHIDDDPIFLRCVKDTVELNNSIVVVGQYTKVRDFLTSLDNIQYDVLIIDYVMPEMNGSDLIHKLRDLRVKHPIISFSSHSFPTYAQYLKEEGIQYTLPKSQLKQLEAFILKSVNKHQVKPKDRKQNELTPDEVELLLLCCNDYSREQMAQRLNIGTDAVKTRKKLLAQKIGVDNKNFHFLKWAIQHGYFAV